MIDYVSSNGPSFYVPPESRRWQRRRFFCILDTYSSLNIDNSNITVIFDCMAEQQQSEQQQFQVAPEAIAELGQRLEEAGYANYVRGLENTVLKAIQSFWGTSKCQVLKDGWAVDLSGPLRGLAYFAVIEPQRGKRVITKFLEESEMFPTTGGTPLVEAEPGPRDRGHLPAPSPMSKALDQVERTPSQPFLPRSSNPFPDIPNPPWNPEIVHADVVPLSESPALVRWKVWDKTMEGSTMEWREEEITYGAVGGMMSGLLARGVEIKDVQVWTSLKTPKLEVTLVSPESV